MAYKSLCSLNEALEFLNDPARKSDPLFDQEAYDARINYKPMEYEDILARAQNIRRRGGGCAVVECPYCHSKNTTKISIAFYLMNSGYLPTIRRIACRDF